MSKHKKRQLKKMLEVAMNGRDRPRCTYCDAAMSRKAGQPGQPPIVLGGETTYPFSQDHIVPRARGGSDHPHNRVPCCGPCNIAKGQEDLVVFIDRLGDRATMTMEEARQMQHRAEAACGKGGSHGPVLQ